LFVTFLPGAVVYTGPGTPFRSGLVACVEPDAGNQNNIRSAAGTPL